jgi:hypothetical protein
MITSKRLMGEAAEVINTANEKSKLNLLAIPSLRLTN